MKYIEAIKTVSKELKELFTGFSKLERFIFVSGVFFLIAQIGITLGRIDERIKRGHD